MTIETQAIVRMFEGEWFNEGHVTLVEGGRVTVDFCDWVEMFKPEDLRVAYQHFQEVWLVERRGTIVDDFRN